MGRRAGERVGAVPGPVDDVPGAVEVAGDDLGDGGVVVHDEDPGPGLGVRWSLLHAASLAPRARERCGRAADVRVP
ncbi:hypothetical protein GCM10010415_09540 [Streptomyces atrovirens]